LATLEKKTSQVGTPIVGVIFIVGNEAVLGAVELEPVE
jgi:hypothetical protein